MAPHQVITAAVSLFAIRYAILLIKQLPASFKAELEKTGAIDKIKVGITFFSALDDVFEKR